MAKKIVVLVLTIVLMFSCFAVYSSALTWQDDPDMSEYKYSTPINFNFNVPGTMSISCSSPYVEFYDYSYYEGPPIQWISYNSYEFNPSVYNNWMTYCTNEFVTSGVQWSDPSARVYYSNLVAYPYIFFDNWDIPHILVDDEFDSVSYVRVRLEQSVRLSNTIYGEIYQNISQDEYVDIPINLFNSDYIIDPTSITGFNNAILEYAEQMIINIGSHLYDLGYSQQYIDDLTISDYLYYDNYQCVMTMAYVGTVNGVDAVEYGDFWIGSDVDFVVPAVDFNIQLSTLPDYPDLASIDDFRADDFDHSRWFLWIGTALSGFMNATLFRFGSINVTIGLIFFSIVAVFGLFFVFRAFAGG